MTKVSIGICCYNEEENIANLLENILNHQKLPPGSEIIVVCSGCTDSTPEIVHSYAERDARIKLIIEKERKGKTSALNKILRTYTGSFLFLIPGDVAPAPFSLPLLLNRMLSDPSIGVVCGRPVPINREEGFSGYLSCLMWRMHNRTLKFLNDLGLNTQATGELMLMRQITTKVPADVVNEDAYLALLASSKNLLVKYCEDAVVYIKAPSNIVDFVRQRRRVVYGHFRVKALTRHFPRTLESMLLYDLSKTVMIVTEEFKEYPQKIPKFLLAILLEGVANLLAIFDLLLKREHTVWRRVDSTKTRVMHTR